MKRLLEVVREVFLKIPKAGKRQTISLTDCLMFALAMFGEKSAGAAALPLAELFSKDFYPKISVVNRLTTSLFSNCGHFNLTQKEDIST